MPQTVNASRYYVVKVNGTTQQTITTAGTDVSGRLSGMSSILLDAAGAGAPNADSLTIVGSAGVVDEPSGSSSLARFENDGDASITVLSTDGSGGNGGTAAIYLGTYQQFGAGGTYSGVLYDHDNNEMILRVTGINAYAFDNNGNFIIGSNIATVSGVSRTMHLENATGDPGTSPSGGVVLYALDEAGSSVLKVRQEDDTVGIVPLSDGSTGGTGSAGTGNQYVAVTVGGSTYKMLHDGTL